MLTITARDLQYRYRRFLAGVLITALVFGIVFVFDGVKKAVQNEATDTVDVFGADSWVVAEDSPNSFLSSAVIPAALSEEIEQTAGVERADPVIVSRTTLELDSPVDVNLIGYEPGGLGAPTVADGRDIRAPGELIVGEGVDLELGDRLRLPGLGLEVVGRTDGSRFLFGTPTIFMSLRDAQEFVFGGQPLAMAIPVVGDPQSVPEGLVARPDADAVTDLRRSIESGIETIEFVTLLLWLITVGIIGSVIYLAAMERTRDFAVLGSVGVPTRQVVGSLVLEALFLSALAAILAIPIAYVVSLGLVFPAALGGSSIVRLFVVAVGVGLVASLAGVRKALSTDPALAFRGS